MPVGFGEPVFDRLDADIAHALMGINAVKGVEIGAGFDSVSQLGSSIVMKFFQMVSVQIMQEVFLEVSLLVKI